MQTILQAAVLYCAYLNETRTRSADGRPIDLTEPFDGEWKSVEHIRQKSVRH